MISDGAHHILNGLLSALTDECRTAVCAAAAEVEAAAVAMGKRKRNSRAPLYESVRSILDRSTRGVLATNEGLPTRALIAILALRLPARVAEQSPPPSVLGQYPAAVDRLANYLTTVAEDSYSTTSDFFQKDLDFALGASFPCGAQVVDPRTYFLWRSVARALSRSGNTRSIINLLQAGARGPWFGIHTESRYLVEFNETGWDVCYRRIADLLVRFPDVRGMMGTSWFYDPALITISPRLAYLQQRPTERGAFLIRHGTSRIDIERATQTSKTRRTLYEAGEYLPTAYTLVWPRRELIAWSTSNQAGG